MNIIVLDKYLLANISKYLSYKNQFQLGLVCKATYNYFKKRIPEIQKVLDAIVCSMHYILSNDLTNELRIYNKYNVQYSNVFRRLKYLTNIDRDIFSKVIEYRFSRNWNNTRKLHECMFESTNSFLSVYGILAQSINFRSDYYLQLLTNDEILEHYKHVIKIMIHRLSMNGKTDELFMEYDNEVIGSLGITMRNEILIGDIIQNPTSNNNIFYMFFYELRIPFDNTLVKWLCCSLGIIFFLYPVKNCNRGRCKYRVFFYIDGQYRLMTIRKYYMIYDMVAVKFNDLYAKYQPVELN